ncbi:TPR domain protein [Aureobasidium pullulans]|uniref:TPR domain protein n=1 Tax=Aureobasidium pullulans TaxID=5580 RepID=A0A4S9LKJ6_AURPU|nr:TPR domain protein [Aureobasidium pullulans]
MTIATVGYIGHPSMFGDVEHQNIVSFVKQSWTYKLCRTRPTTHHFIYHHTVQSTSCLNMLPILDTHREDAYDYDLGSFHRAVSTQQPHSQRWFDRGLIWSYAFNHLESARCFQAAVDSDPTCAMAYWGLAYALGPNYNKPWELFDEEDLERTLGRIQDAVKKASTLAASPTESALIAAIQVRCPSHISDTNYEFYNEAYAKAMSSVYKAFPEDLDVVTLYADALMNVTPWALWNLNTGKPNPAAYTLEVKQVLELALVKSPDAFDHPGLAHMYIHLMEMSNTPKAAMPIANRLRRLTPDAGHMNHMPSHLDVLVGDWTSAIEANAAACVADEKYRLSHPDNTRDFYTMYRLHNYHSLIYAAMFAGRKGVALDAVLKMEDSLSEELLCVQSPPLADWLEVYCTVRVHVFIRFGLWDDLIVLPLPEPEKQPLYCMTTAMIHYGKGIAYAATGRIVDASQQRELFQVAVRRVPASRMMYPNKCVDMLAVAQGMLDGELEYRKGSLDVAFTHLEEAISREDALLYSEPPAWMQPVRHALGALSLEQGRVQEAAAAFKADLGLNHDVPRAKWHPNNVWALHGYHESLIRLGRLREAEELDNKLKAATRDADVEIKASCFCRRSITEMASTTSNPVSTDPADLGFYLPSHTALLLLDFHEMFLQHAGPSANTAVATAVEMRKWATSHGILVIHALIDTAKSAFPSCKDANRFNTTVAAMVSSGTIDEPTSLTEGAGAGELTFARKPGHVSALKSPGLMEFLYEKGIKSLILTGLSTSGCVLRTALQATDEEFVVTVVRDGCADADGELHEVLMGKLLSSRGHVMNAAEVRDS